MQRVIWSLLLISGAAWSQTSLPDEIPADSQPIAGEELRARVSGKVFKFTAPGTPGTARLQYNANGFVFLNGSNGTNDGAPWRIEGSQLCSAWRKIPASCSEMRVKGDVLFAKRTNGTWATLTPD